MVPELEKPRVTEIQVRMDCNGCIQKIKKALQGINGIYDLNIDFPQQKLTVVGWADPEKIMKAIKKTRKIATICSHTELSDPAPEPADPAPEGAPPASDTPNPTPTEAPPAETTPPAEPPKDPPPPENPAPEATPPPPEATTNPATQPDHPSEPKDAEEIHVIYHHPPDYSYNSGHRYGAYSNNYHNGHGFQPEPPIYVTHSYNTYKPSPSISQYEYARSPPRHTRYSQPEQYSEDYLHHSNSDGNNITSMFSDENPNACRIV